MTLIERVNSWIAAEGWSDMEVGFRWGCDRTYVRKILDGDRTPGLRVAAAIERLTANLTGGPIRCVEWDKAPVTRAPQSGARRSPKPKRARRRGREASAA